ncbi:MAG: hypothetical protein AAGF89_07300, partial [Bacteroidota bacterium]
MDFLSVETFLLAVETFLPASTEKKAASAFFERMEHTAATSGVPSSDGGFSCSSMVRRCCKWLEHTWPAQQAAKLDACVGSTWPCRTFMACLCLQPPIDLLTDFQQIWFFSSEGWWFSLSMAALVWYASVRFGLI